MGERKVQAKYYPPDFDPSQLPPVKKKRENDDAVRFMLPMSVRCETCGEFMGCGLKFNARKSNTGDDYLGIRIFRFSMKCKGCPATFCIRTDPKNSDYSCESGVRRNYEPWRDAKNVEEEAHHERQRQDQDAIQALENRTLDAKRQMEDLDALDDIKLANAKRAHVNIDDILTNYKGHGTKLSDMDEAQIEQELGDLLRERETAATKPVMDSFQSCTKQLLSQNRSISRPLLLPNLRLNVKKKISKDIHCHKEGKSSLVSVKAKAKVVKTPSPQQGSLVAYSSDDSSGSSGSEKDR